LTRRIICPHITVNASACTGIPIKLVVKVEGTPDHEGMVIDFLRLKAIVKENVLCHLDHACLNDIIPVPSAENISVWVWSKLVALLKSRALSAYTKVEVWETLHQRLRVSR